MNFKVSRAQEEQINASRGERFSIDNPIPDLERNGDVYKVDRFNLHGESSLYFRRKSFSVNMDDHLAFYIEGENRTREIEEFKLISMVFDYTYIEEGIAIGLCRELDLWPMFSTYTELKLNSNSQGLYLFIEDPEEYYLFQRDAGIVLRRKYNHSVEKYQLNALNTSKTADDLLVQFEAIYQYIAVYDEEQLYDSLSSVMDIQQYFKKIALDMLLKNGDYTDEVFFYTSRVNGKEIFGVQPWDYDDIFSDQPHEIGRTWGTGSVFGNRTYPTLEDWQETIGDKLIYSIEDDLDYKIAMDNYLYSRYLEVLENMLANTLTESVIERVISNTRGELLPYYGKTNIIAQSQYDEQSTNLDLFENNLVAKHQFINDRRSWILQQIAAQ